MKWNQSVVKKNTTPKDVYISGFQLRRVRKADLCAAAELFWTWSWLAKYTKACEASPKIPKHSENMYLGAPLKLRYSSKRN